MVYLLLADGFEDLEAVAPIDVLRRADIPLTTVGVSDRRVTSAHGLTVEADAVLDGLDVSDMEMLVLPGGPGVDNLRHSPAVKTLLRDAARAGKLIGAICAAPALLAELGLLKGKRAVCFPDCEQTLTDHGVHIETDRQVTHDLNIITARAAGSAVEFALKLTAMLRGWGAAEAIRAAIHHAEADKSLT
ncbi:MAG: DJ-1/PfpI family protein [Oscillospiraceae bacterium]|jgi:4-methyl-5(b-hydroxyethyl)-thiazole monophosphate biosynthesis|nr:DJ-1/PfpI family protein [Oscillospiraceae bacterium]